jgi:predicted enzyme related to lactoylglutathione lyase
MTLGVNHITFAVMDLARAVEFYTKVLRTMCNAVRRRATRKKRCEQRK